MLSKNKLGFAAVVSLFFFWALAHNLNPILIPQLKKALELSDFQSAWVDSSFYVAYFLMALPAGILIEKIGYRGTIVSGLVLFALGAWLFIPAANFRSFPFFLGALFVLASGLTLLETAANPFVNAMGERSTAGRRLNFAQAFNGLGATLAAFLGARFILSGKQQDALNPSEFESLNAWLQFEANQVKMPYFLMGLFVLVMAIVFKRIPLPEIQQDNTEPFSLKKLASLQKLKWAVLAQFVYVGAQVGVSSFFIRYAVNQTKLSDQESALRLSLGLFLFMLGRFAGSALMKKIKPETVLQLFTWMATLCMTIASFLGGELGLLALTLTPFFMSVMFPTIFSFGIQHSQGLTRYASSLLIMSIVGGAIIPLFMGAVSDNSSIQYAFIIPLVCFVTIGIITPKIKV